MNKKLKRELILNCTTFSAGVIIGCIIHKLMHNKESEEIMEFIVDDAHNDNEVKEDIQENIQPTDYTEYSENNDEIMHAEIMTEKHVHFSDTIGVRQRFANIMRKIDQNDFIHETDLTWMKNQIANHLETYEGIPECTAYLINEFEKTYTMKRNEMNEYIVRARHDYLEYSNSYTAEDSYFIPVENYGEDDEYSINTVFYVPSRGIFVDSDVMYVIQDIQEYFSYDTANYIEENFDMEFFYVRNPQTKVDYEIIMLDDEEYDRCNNEAMYERELELAKEATKMKNSKFYGDD